VVDRLEFMNWV